MRRLLALSLVIGFAAAAPARAVTVQAFNGSLTRSAETPVPLAAMSGREGFARIEPPERGAAPAFSSILAEVAARGLPRYPRGPRAVPALLAGVPPWFGTATPPFGPPGPRGPRVPRGQAAQDPVAVPAAAALPLLLSALAALSFAARRRA